MKALFVTASGHGHFLPLVPIAAGLADSGDEVAFAAPSHFAHVVREAGFRVFELGDAEGRGRLDRHVHAQIAADAKRRGVAAVEYFLSEAVVETPTLVETAGTWAPDVIVRETTAWAGWLAGELLDVPVAVLDFAPTPPGLLAAAAGSAFQAARAAVGLGPDDRLGSLYRWLHLVAAPPGWFARPVFGPTSHLFQPPADQPSDLALRDLMPHRDESRPLVYATLGTKFQHTPGVFAAILDALAESEADVIATLGPGAAGTPASYPTNITVLDYVSQSAVLPHVDAVVCHAGYGSLMGAVRRGVPIVAIPLANSDAAVHAVQVERMGIGVVLDAVAATSDAIAAAVSAVLTGPGFRDAASTLARETRTLPELSRAAALVRRLALSRAPMLSRPMRAS